MKMLVGVTSRHGGTLGIATAIADELHAAGIEVDVQELRADTSVAGYDAVVLGSAVYMGSWMPEARRFVERHREALARLPVWLFSSGPLGADGPKPSGDPPRLPEVMEATHARGHHVFAGRLDQHELGVGERLVAKMVHAPYGDFRDWDAVRAWARGIAAEMCVPER
jgi:menaquinone-dependent protoporphyrinogen oxidase